MHFLTLLDLTFEIQLPKGSRTKKMFQIYQIVHEA
jgi:hypothetical protein